MAFGGDNPDSYYDEGLTASMKGDVASAIRHFERVLEMNPSFIPAFHQLGKCYQRLGQIDRAVSFFQKAADAKPNHIPMRIDLGYGFLEQGNIVAARQIFEHAILTKPDNYRAQLGLANCAFHEGQWGSATALAQTALNMASGDNFGILYLLGRSAIQSGDTVLAKEIMERADSLIEKLIETNPDQPEGYFMRGEVYFAQSMIDKALDNYRAAEDRVAANRIYSMYGEHFSMVDVLAKRGLCYQRMGNAERAMEAGQRILAISPQHKIGNMLAALKP